MEDHDTSLLPPVTRILRETCEKIRAAGHEVVDLEFYKSEELSDNAVALFQVEGGKVPTHPPILANYPLPPSFQSMPW
jgi:hypothetical protein